MTKSKRKKMTLQELFSDKSRWCKGMFAMDKEGDSVDWMGENAVSWCLLGASYRFLKRSDISKLLAYFKDVGSISKFNDKSTTTIRDIRKLVKKLDI